MERRAVDVIEVITNTGLKYEESEGKIDVCQAIQEMKKEAELKKDQQSAKNLYELRVEIEKIARGLGYAVETVKGWLGLTAEVQ